MSYKDREEKLRANLTYAVEQIILLMKEDHSECVEAWFIMRRQAEEELTAYYEIIVTCLPRCPF